jgi:hypothetical protein
VRLELLLLAVAALALAVKAVRSAWHAPNASDAGGPRVRALAAILFLLQPIARLTGRLRGGLTPWRRRGELAFTLPWPRRRTVWSERWASQTDRLLELEGYLRERCMSVVRGGDTDRWDIQVRLGALGSARLRVAVEEHGQGRQLVRYRIWPRWSRALPLIVALLALWVAGCAQYDISLAALIGAALLLVVLRACREAGAGVALVLRAIANAVETPDPESEARELLDDLRVSRPAVNEWNGSRVHVSTPGELGERSR